MRSFALVAALAALAATLVACSFVSQQVGITGANDCIRKQCRDPNAADYTQCEAACRTQYQK